MYFISSFFKGIFIGIGAILPGISSGVICVILGIYNKLIESIIGLFKNFKENFNFLFPILLGVIIGFFSFSNILNFLYNSYESECKSLFLGFIIGSIPSLFKAINTKTKSKKSYLLFTIFSFIISLILFLLESNLNTLTFNNQYSFIYLFLAGMGMSTGIIIPGISSTIILMCFGIYNIYLNAISILDFTILIPIVLGIILGSALFLLLMKYLLNKYYLQTYYTIIGFVLGSTLIILPTSINILTLLLIFLGILISYNLEHLKK